MQYDAIAVSNTDLTAGLPFFRSQENTKLPWVSANLFTHDGERVFLPFVIKEAPELLVGIVGLTGGQTKLSEDFVIRSWQDTLSKQLEILNERCDLIIVLSNLESKENIKIAETFPEVDLILSADKRRGNVPGYPIRKSTLLSQTANRGRYLGKLDISWYDGVTWKDPKEKTIEMLEKELSSINWRVNQINAQIVKAQETKTRTLQQKLDNYKRKALIVEEKIKDRKKTLALGQQGIQNTYSYQALKIQPDETDETVQAIVKEIKTNIANYNRAKRRVRLTEKQSDLLQMSEIAGSSQCAECHPKQTRFWQTTSHSSSFQTLVSNGQNYNTDCLPCHVTGGSITIDSDEDARGLLLTLPTDRNTVGCEVCHGPAAEHALSPETVLPNRIPVKDSCLHCHTPEMDHSFMYEKKLHLTACPNG